MYIQARFLPEGHKDDDSKPTVKDSSPEDDRRKEGVYGKLKFVVKSARDLADKDSFGSGVSDPFTRIILPDGQKKDTKAIKDNLNPDWNETVVFDVKIDKDVHLDYSANKTDRDRSERRR